MKNGRDVGSVDWQRYALGFYNGCQYDVRDPIDVDLLLARMDGHNQIGSDTPGRDRLTVDLKGRNIGTRVECDHEVATEAALNV
jgi:hypothetical protein